MEHSRVVRCDQAHRRLFDFSATGFELAGQPRRWRLRHATLKEVAYASLPKRERLRLHRNLAEELLKAGHRSWAADHFELAALASLDLDPNDRQAPEQAADALLVAGDRARRRMESRWIARARRWLVTTGSCSPARTVSTPSSIDCSAARAICVLWDGRAKRP